MEAVNGAVLTELIELIRAMTEATSARLRPLVKRLVAQDGRDPETGGEIL
jgi:hypothetical protein